ncbi:S9 family peptidase [Salibacteraceae bacterium]|jgi:dipeptidyl aminopeptidase/acylaminoacyl peptidase|nr:S9 family peptidase [Salibacteraceae bacterium]
MKINLLFAMASFGLFLTSCQEQAASNQEEVTMTAVREIPLEDFFKNPDKSSYQISPDGMFYSFMAPYESRMNVFIQKIGDSESMRITDVTDRDIAGYTWVSNERILYLKDNGGDENFALYAVNIDGSNPQSLTAFDSVRTELIDDLEDQEDYVMVGLNKRDQRIYDPYRLNVQTGELSMLAENPGNISGWMTDHEGKLRVALTTDGVNNSLMYRETEDSEWEILFTGNFKESLDPLFFTFDNKNLYVSSNVGRDKSAIRMYDVAKKELGEILFEHPDVDVSNLSYSRKRKVLTTVSYTIDKRERSFLDAETEAWFKKLEAKLAGYEIGISGRSKDESKLVVRTYSDRSLGAYYFYDIAEDRLEKLEDVSPWVQEDEMAEMQPVSYQSRDGLTIRGYLTLPKGKEAKNLPVVVNVHGGPWARDYWGYSNEVQFLANRGYAVLQMNYRGSVGFGRAFWEASFKQWGQAMQDDVSDGAQWLIDQGIADSSRVAIYGGSYGGYATLAGLTYTPNLYACGVDYVGVSNLFTFMETIPPYWTQYLEMLYEMVGHPEADSAMLAAYSPSLNAEKITAPLFIAQGANDPRVKKSEADQMVEAMKARGVEVEYLVKDDEGHGFRNEENRFDFYRAMEKFLAKHIGDQATVETES